MAALPRDSLQQLHDNTTIELRARADRVDQILQEQKINIEQLWLQRDEAVTQKQQMEKVVVEACLSAQSLDITGGLPVDAHIRMFSMEF